MTSREEFYRARADEYNHKAALLQQREDRLSLARLISFLSAFLLFVLLFSFSVTISIIALIAGLFTFVAIVIWHIKTQKLKEYNSHIALINTHEAECIGGSFNSFADGSEYINREHPYSYDLDIFGHASLFQYINRTASRPAADMLALWLSAPAAKEEILLRQQAAEELKPMIDWRQKMMTLCFENKNAGADPESLLAWVKSESAFPNGIKQRITSLLLTTTVITATVLVICGMPAGLLAAAIIINIIYYTTQAKQISKLHLKVTRSSEMLETYASTIQMIEEGQFHSARLSDLHKTFTATTPVSELIGRLSKLVNRLDTRLNILVSFPLNVFFFWDIHACLALDKWNSRHSGEVIRWLNAMAEFEVLSSLGNMAFNNPGWIIPSVTDEYFILKAKDMGHPLIPEQHRIKNDIDLEGRAHTALITGSNMSGKSTFLRTCGINTVLALAGSAVCASSFNVSLVKVFSSMRISDSLEDNTSSFYAELKRLAAIIREAENNPKVFLLLDEILRGTNSNDRYTGSVALIKQLTDYGAVSMVATHDLKLADLSDELPGKIDNYHFDVKIKGEELFFDYKLTPGICTSLNASILMKKMGIKV
jgi:ABC-type multidrug transport system fused ATPase/permease subunit